LPDETEVTPCGRLVWRAAGPAAAELQVRSAAMLTALPTSGAEGPHSWAFEGTGGQVMLGELLPKRLDNEYRGHKLALWLFGLVVALKSAQSLAILLNGYATARDADGIPLDTFSAEAAQTVVAVFAQGSLWRLFFCLLGGLVLLRYRSAVPLMLALLALNYLSAQLVLQLVPLPRVGAPIGPLVNLLAFVVMVVGLGFSLWRRGGSSAGGYRAG
jgi:hypothetical protein